MRYEEAERKCPCDPSRLSNCEGPHLDKECPLKEEVKQVEEAKYGEFGRPALFNGSNGSKYHVGPPGYYTRTNNRPPYGEKRPSLEEHMNNHLEESARRSTQMNEWIKKLKESAEQCKVVNDDLETQHRPISSKKLINKEGWTTKDLQCQLLPKEQNPGNFTLLCTISNFNLYGMDDLDASVNVMPRNIFKYLKLANLRNTNMLVEMADMTKKAPLGITENILVRIDKFLFPLDFVIIDKTPNERIILGRPFLVTIHAEINIFDKEISLGTNNDGVGYDMEKRDRNFTIPTENNFMIKSNLDNRPLTPASSNNQTRNLHDRSLDDSLHDKNRRKIKIELDQHISRAHFCKPVKQTIDEQTKMWLTCDPTKGMYDGGNKIYEVSKVETLRFWYYNYDNERKNITGVGLSFLDYLLEKYEKYQTDSLIWDDTYVEWCNTSPTPGTPFLYGVSMFWDMAYPGPQRKEIDKSW
ncbi:reverse transcriptase domain-containing protein [Tanacetum coccineum]